MDLIVDVTVTPSTLLKKSDKSRRMGKTKGGKDEGRERRREGKTKGGRERGEGERRREDMKSWSVKVVIH